MEETQSRFHDVHEDSTLQPSSLDKTDLCSPAKKLNRTERVASLKESSSVHDAHTFEPERTMHVKQSPHESADVIRVDQHRDDASFGLYNSSFETLSDAEGAFGVDETMLNPEEVGDGMQFNVVGTPSMFSPSSVPTREGAVENAPCDIALPDLKTDHSSELSIGDLSPIKVAYTKGRTPRIERRSSPYGFDGLPDSGSVLPFDWRSDSSLHLYNTRSNPFFVLRSARKAFANVKYLLPCLQVSFSGTGAIHLSDIGGIRHYRDRKGDYECHIDLIMATRRVESAICAFGGTLRNRESLRVRPDDESRYSEYVHQLADRYTVHDSSLSWDVEENSPVDFHHDRDTFDNVIPIQDRVDRETKGDAPTSGSRTDASSYSEGTMNDPTKVTVKYRCKLCGQWKQNHQCRYQQPLQRSIGVMVYPAVNSYTAAEPGVIAPSLTKMNNFVSYDSDPGEDGRHSDHATQRRPKTNNGDPFAIHTSTVTPESLRGATHFHSPQSSLSAQSSDDPMSRHDGGTTNASTGMHSRRYLKRPHNDLMLDSASKGGYDSTRSVLPFVASVTLRPEHYRAVTPLTKDASTVTPEVSTRASAVAMEASSVQLARSNMSTRSLYEYPAISLSFKERKRLSDTLFYLAQEIPAVTSECAALLRSARRQGEWDVAVAELLTQVVVALYCGEGDARLDGLQQYLLTIGISC